MNGLVDTANVFKPGGKRPLSSPAERSEIERAVAGVAEEVMKQDSWITLFQNTKSAAKKIVEESQQASDMACEADFRKEVSTARINKCLALFKEGKEQEAMKWMLHTRNQQQLCIDLINQGDFQHALQIARLLGPRMVKNISEFLLSKGKYDLAEEMVCAMPTTGYEPDILGFCQYLINDGRDDLAIKLSHEKLNDAYKFKLCTELKMCFRFDLIREVYEQMSESSEEKKVVAGWLEANSQVVFF